MEENFIAPSEGDEADAEMTEAASISPKSLAQQLNIGNPVALERKIKQQLEDIGEKNGTVMNGYLLTMVFSIVWL